MSAGLRLATVLALCLAGGLSPALAQSGARVALQGAGATFPAPLYKKWIGEYAKADSMTAIDYRDVGSGEGARRFLARQVDFGASDAGLSDEQLAAAGDAKLIPTTAGMIVLAYNAPNIGGPLKLSRTTYVDLLNGRIPKWNDARIEGANPGLKLPARDIGLAVRLDASGTTYALTNHLNAASDRWRRTGQGVTNLVDWRGTAMRAKGNEGVAALIQRNPWTIGYVEYGYAKRLGLAMAHIENKAGKFVEPSAASGTAAIAANPKEVPEHLRVFFADPEGEDAYPIVTLTWLLLRDRHPDPAKGEALKRFVDWALTKGQPYGAELGFVPLPQGMLERALAAARATR